MRFVKKDVNIDFIRKKNTAFYFSLSMILVSILSLVIHQGPRYGIDFAGGTLIQVRFSSPVDISDIKKGLISIALEGSSVQRFGDGEDNEYLIRTIKSRITGEGFSLKIQDALNRSTGQKAEIRRIEMVGPQVGKDLREKALFAIFFALLFITVYISGRFEFKWMISGVTAGALMAVVYVLNFFTGSIALFIIGALIITLVLFRLLELRYAMGAIVALIHDVTITVGLFSLLDIEFTLPIIAALLTIIGYSLNDTIIVFDRIRENLRKYHKNPLSFIINKSINETLSRTILTSITTLFVVVTLYVMGGGIIHDFAFAMLVGVIIGTYSSVFVASPILLVWQGGGKRK